MIVPGSVLGLALVVVLADLSHLLEEGGWYAVFGQFLAVATTLIMIAIGGVVVVALLALPFLFCFSIFEELQRPIGPLAPRAWLYRAANAGWKAIWWCWWRLSGRRSAAGGN
jgi:hypothetical protein